MRSPIRNLWILILVAALLLGIAAPAFAAGGIAVNTATGAIYTDVAQALQEAAEGQVVQLTGDATGTVLLIPEGVELDLNGHTLAATYLSCFGDLTDRAGNGCLKVSDSRFLIQPENAQLPVQSEEGFRFADVTRFNTAYLQEKSTFAFQPFIGASVHEFLKKGAAESGVTVKVRISWDHAQGVRNQDFVYSDALINTILGSYYTVSGADRYSQMFTLALQNVDEFEKLTFRVVVASKTGVEFTSDPVIYEKEPPQEPDPILETRTVSLLPEVKSFLPGGALASAPGVQFATAPYAYTNTALFAGKHITRIGIPVKSVKALDENQTFTLSVVKTTSNAYQYVSQTVLKLPLDQLGSSTTVNKWIYLDVDLQLAADETLAFGMPTDTVEWGYLSVNNSLYNFRSATGSWSSVIQEAIFFDITATETLVFRETEQGLAAVTETRVFPDVLTHFPDSAIAGGNPVEFTNPPYSYVNQSYFAGSRITKIGIPVKTVKALDENQIFELSVIKQGSGAYQYVKQYELKLPLDQLGDSTTVNKWVYVDVDIPLAEDETLAFGGKNESVIWAWKSGYNNTLYAFRDGGGGQTKGIFFDIYKTTVLTYADYLAQKQAEEERIAAEQEQAEQDAQLQAVLNGKGISILGDSISTFQGYSNNTSYNSTIGSNAVYYNGSTDGFAAVGETWWMQTISRTGMELVVNNSWSGDTVSGRGVSRALQLHNNANRDPDIIAVYLGINDFRTKVTAEVFAEKYEQMLSGLLLQYDKADVYLFTLLYTTNVASGVTPADVVSFNAIIAQLAERYGCTLVDLYNDTGITDQNLATYMGDGKLHPNYAGMDRITDCFLEALRENYTRPKPLISTEEFIYGSYFDHDRFTGNTGTRLTSGAYNLIRSADALLPRQDITIQVADSNLTNYKVTLGFYTKDGIYTGRTGILPMTDGVLTIKASAMTGAYFRVNVYLYNGSFTKVPESAIIEVYGGEQQKPPVQPEAPDTPDTPAPAADVKLTILGDSISTGGYTGILTDLTGATLQNLSASGTLLAGGLTGKVASVDADADIIIVFGGTNDYWHKNVSIGTADSTDSRTFTGALRYILTSLQTSHPEARYLFVFPPEQTFGGNPSSTDFGYGTLEDFRQAFLTFCKANAVDYVDLGDTEFDPAKHSGDGVHPNTAGHQIIADAIYNAIAPWLETE